VLPRTTAWHRRPLVLPLIAGRAHRRQRPVLHVGPLLLRLPRQRLPRHSRRVERYRRRERRRRRRPVSRWEVRRRQRPCSKKCNAIVECCL